ncbi:zinc-dependent alcohol dehydrogenase family protein [Hyphococcus luteus]|uniref:NAD(P)-dependent alcohol dehydrogenase n=1 Tax=Hyphococcus luteus TaxID=2058213 RepID=A0A2S7JZK6_9PROT|nr:NAD(P)-dependent alcohol dehydrogenase [Marinicaulis flavus]PQA85684.1 NAD(P)-dependent alcohol dehydrogenase [Marinicaulis flavus]
MKKYVLKAGSTSLDSLVSIECDTPQVKPHEVLIRVHACSLNFRDQAVVTGNYFGGVLTEDTVPLSDGAGEVAAVGDEVTEFKVGDRVAGLFFQNWHDGPPNPTAGPALGAAGCDGMLAEYVCLPEAGVTKIPETLSYEEAATLPCAGVTAWNALMCGRRPIKAGDCVCVLGTGGVSMIGLGIAHAAGAHVVVTSSSDEKLERAKKLGAAAGVNYKSTPEWGPAVAAASNRGGADVVVEVGGAGTLAQSMQAVNFNGEIALIGVLTREGDTTPHPLMLKGASIRGIFVGNKAMAEDLAAAIDVNGMKPAIDKVFPYEDAAEAFRHQQTGAFGKVVIKI